MLAAAAVVSGLVLGGGASGLLVPDAGPRTSSERARASLVCGEVVNVLRGKPACAAPLVRLDPNAALRLELPAGGDQPNDRRYPIVLTGAEGLLTSDSTRIPGLVSIADIGRGAVRVVPHDDPVAYLKDLDERISDNAYARIRAFILAAGILLALALVAPRAAVAGFVAVPAANLALGAAGVSELWAVLLVTGLAAGSGLALARLPLVPLSIAVVAAYLGALAAEGTWVSLSPLGPSQNGRFFGLSNLLATLLLVPALVGASRRATFLPAAVLAVVMVAGSSFGADGGGAVVLVAAFAVLAAGLFGRLGGLAAATAVAVAAALAIVIGPSTHVTSAGSADLPDRVQLSLERIADDWLFGAAAVVALVLLALLALRDPRRPLPLALAVGVAVSMAVNDSPFEVAVAGLVGYLALRRYDSSG
ncbi:MAG: hypothetical protein WD689_02810 [Gaiellaceae bacterium]